MNLNLRIAYGDIKNQLLEKATTNVPVLAKTLAINIKRMYYIALVAIPVHLIHVILFWRMTPSSQSEISWRAGIMTIHGIYVFVELIFLVLISRIKKGEESTTKKIFIQYSMIGALAFLAVSLVTVDQYVTTNITPFLVLCVGIGIFFLTRPAVTFAIYGIIMVFYYFSIAIVQREAAILLTNRVNGITFVAFGICVSLILWNGNRKNLILQEELDRQQRKLEEKNIELERLAYLDTLTGLYNRRKWLELVQEQTQLIRRYSNEASLILIDLDNFKEVNDRFGHPAGDLVLEKVATILKENLRVVDKACRWGGEEFIILLPQLNSTKAKGVAEKLRNVLENTDFYLEDNKINIKASFGVTHLDSGPDSFQTAYGRADKALYTAKENGRNRVVGNEF